MALEIQKDRFTISNDFISLTFLLQKGRLVSFALSNVLSGKTLTPERGDVFELRFAGAFGGETVRAGELKVQSALPAEDAAGFSMKVFFKPFRVRGCKTELQLCVALGKTDSFLKTWLQLHASGGEKAVLDYVDFAPFFVRAGEKLGGVPFPEKKKDAALLSLGQPVYWEHSFFGCTFPGALNAFQNERLCARRYYGRSLAELCDANGVFESDCAVWGVAAKNDPVSVRTAFLRYLENTLPPASERSALWFSSSPLEPNAVQALFAEEKRLQGGGAPFYDSVMLDKRAAFPDIDPFTFPDQVPQGLRNFGAAAASLGASLGMAVGLPLKTKGLFRSKVRTLEACLSNEALLASFRDFVLSLSQKCGVTDWQLHLPLSKPCREKDHGHPVGGDFQLHYYSDVFEKWINLLSSLQNQAAKPLHFFLCGACSPWLLQWADAIGLPASPQTADPDSALHALWKAGITVPPERLFVPQPDTATSHPFGGAKRTPALFGAVQSAALARQRQLQSDFRALLGRTVPVDKESDAACCTFAAFDSGEGLLTLHNPSAQPQDVNLTLDESLGVPQRFLCVGVTELMPKVVSLSKTPLRFGDHLRQTLAPGETKVLHLGSRKAPPCLLSAAATDKTTLRLRFDKPVDLTTAACTQNAVQTVTPDDDNCGGTLVLTYPFTVGNNLTFTGVRDLNGAELTVNAVFMFSESGLVPLGSLCGTGAFSIKVTFGSEANLQMYMQTERLLLAAEDGHITFKVGDTVLRSRSRTDDVVQVCAVREQSGTLKLYLNGKLEQSIRPLTKPCDLVAAAPLCFDEKRTKLYARALAFDEV